ncbi:hypothetical protein KR009_006852 [Drosophila setifemur]|nr:hypothetical protein KR009_006852 [Drosophila setifemur]
MFESISFLFLSALAFIAWAVLCFLHVIDIQRRSASEFRVELFTEHPAITFAPHVCRRDMDESPMPGNVYDFVKSFAMIFGLTFGLSKVLQLAERKAKGYINAREELCLTFSVKSPSVSEEKQSQILHKLPEKMPLDENVDLKEHLYALQAHCLEMRDMLQELRASSSFSSQSSANASEESEASYHTASEGFDIVWRRTESIAKPNLKSQPYSLAPEEVSKTSDSQYSQNIYITNSQIYINGRVFWMGNTVNIDLCRQASMYYISQQSEFLQVWDKFITGPKERPMITGMRCNM